MDPALTSIDRARTGFNGPDEFAESSDQEQPLLDFGDARDDSLFPELKAASKRPRIPCGPDMGRAFRRLQCGNRDQVRRLLWQEQPKEPVQRCRPEHVTRVGREEP